MQTSFRTKIQETVKSARHDAYIYAYTDWRGCHEYHGTMQSSTRKTRETVKSAWQDTEIEVAERNIYTWKRGQEWKTKWDHVLLSQEKSSCHPCKAIRQNGLQLSLPAVIIRQLHQSRSVCGLNAKRSSKKFQINFKKSMIHTGYTFRTSQMRKGWTLTDLDLSGLAARTDLKARTASSILQ